jgi:hypothetical protein
MITRFFRTSKPIHFVIVAFVTFIAFMGFRLSKVHPGLGIIIILQQILLYLLVLVPLFVLDFLVSKNNLTKKNNYKLLLFGLFFLVLPITFQFNNLLLAHIFVLLALRRIISLRSNLNVKKKLFDAGFWIAIASLFYFWAILFFALILIALLIYSIGSIKNWIIPFTGVLVVILILVSGYIIMNYELNELSRYLDTTDFDFTAYNDLSMLIGITSLVSLGLWSLIFYLKNLNDKRKRQRSSHILVTFALIISGFLIILAPDKDGSEFIFVFAPLSIIMSNYLESLKEPWFAELFVWILILTPISTLFL